MKAGRELDAKIAEEVMGLTPLRQDVMGQLIFLDDVGDECFCACYSTQIADAKIASDKAGSVVVFAPGASVRDGCYANRKKEWLVEIIPHGGITYDAVWAYGETEELARCLAALKAVE